MCSATTGLAAPVARCPDSLPPTLCGAHPACQGRSRYAVVSFPTHTKRNRGNVFGTTDNDPNAMTHEDALQSLARLTYLIYDVKGARYARLIQPDDDQRALFDALGIHFPRESAKAL